MSSSVKSLQKSLEYLEEVRQHMSRLPSIDATKNTLLVCGKPNVGKSSFVNLVSNANVDVQNYPFTTQSLYLGHFDRKNGGERWQILDTPGILEHSPKHMNTIEMQSVTAMAHLNSIMVYFIDISGESGCTVDEQIDLFKELKPLLTSKYLIVLTKADRLPNEFLLELQKVNISHLNEKEIKFSQNDYQEILNEQNERSIINEKDSNLVLEFLKEHKFLITSSKKNINIELVKETACDILVPYVPLKISQPKKVHPKSEKVYTNNQSFSNMNKINEEIKIPEFYNGYNINDYKLGEVDVQTLIENKNLGKIDFDDYKEYNVLSDVDKLKQEMLKQKINEKKAMSAMKKRSSVPDKWKSKNKNYKTSRRPPTKFDRLERQKKRTLNNNKQNIDVIKNNHASNLRFLHKKKKK